MAAVPAGSLPPMGLYREHVVPRLVDVACGSAGFDRWRAQAADGLAGRVVEVGFGSGRHLTRDASSLVEKAGFVMQRNKQRYARGPNPWCWLTVGLAAKPAG
jgi:hypothetical protein